MLPIQNVVTPPKRLLPLLNDIASRFNIAVVMMALNNIQTEKYENLINLTGKTTLEDVLNIIACASFVIGNETGPLILPRFGPFLPSCFTVAGILEDSFRKRLYWLVANYLVISATGIAPIRIEIKRPLIPALAK